jgi:hypothetical protein
MKVKSHLYVIFITPDWNFRNDRLAQTAGKISLRCSGNQSNTSLKRVACCPLKGSNFDIYFHRKDAEHAEDLLYFFSAIFASRAKWAVKVHLPTRIA